MDPVFKEALAMTKEAAKAQVDLLGSKVGAHTPGPWYAKRTKLGIQVHTGPVGANLAGLVICDTNWENAGNQTANACLIAAAPELAEALRAACPDGIEENCDECAPGPCAGCWVINARAALAKLDTDSTK